MPEQITISVPSDVKQALDKAIQREGVSASELIGQAIKQYLLLQQFRLLRDRMVPKAQASGIGSDQDVFDRVS